MEGPSLFLAAEWLRPLIGKTILRVDGNTRIGKERLQKKKIMDIFSWGKHLVFQFNDFAMRIHFMLYGSFEATINHEKVTGDYPKKKAPPRLSLRFRKGEVVLFNCSLRFIETSHAQRLYDFSTDLMSPSWDASQALKKIRKLSQVEIGDVLLDQTLFSGAGNIIKNEVLFLVKIQPTTLVDQISLKLLRKIIETTKTFSQQFYEWRKQFVLKQHYQIYRQSICPLCGKKVTKKWTGERRRVSFFCSHCQK